MKIYIMRHGQAGLYANSDAERELTGTGRQQSADMADWLSAIEPTLDCVLHSPYIRAAQTWDVIGNFFTVHKVEVCEDITPYGDAEFIADYVKALVAQHNYETVLLVSHLPVVSYLTSAMTAGKHMPAFATSAIACLEMNGNDCHFKWLETPASIK
ncbi:phosphohistidine phosphatase SixA [Moritella sp. F3]|uniref:phosphohistidine phosphatase SixA n=1 Tax=Moritella sp. F3 TaxID=2718882 RepID=UPI0018E127E2|nr:phosphohistidine phosphatase SixA [Moritella sp. F3]GIC75439.1 phosphohistidine phosphatase SixA [Moritella sp. F1]GIC80584.1 phosphohistidine phosphatase SixA [Moritella sp. F3]